MATRLVTKKLNRSVAAPPVPLLVVVVVPAPVVVVVVPAPVVVVVPAPVVAVLPAPVVAVLPLVAPEPPPELDDVLVVPSLEASPSAPEQPSTCENSAMERGRNKD
ncbi:hypothetical protein [Sorangium cellulosum]|uniref:hypothetical protein n=1 Tax=Sorangium cellulosum TaxID=56 RepID=UPI0013ECA7A3|nr:hypothetical protein [Sorangium cellulosum]